MNRCYLPHRVVSTHQLRANRVGEGIVLRVAAGIAIAVLLSAGSLAAQVLTIDTSGKGGVATSGPVDRQFQQITPTHVDLTKSVLDPKARLMVIRAMQSEQGFAMRPFPRGHKGLTLVANGKLEPAGTGYLNMVVSEGLSAKPGQRLVITDVKVDKSKIVFDLNGGPDAKHRFMRHIQIGMGPDMDDPDMDLDPTLLGQSGDPAGARLTLAFGDHIPELTPEQVKALLAPLISFDVKTPIQAYTDTLPKALREAILNHHVWVGMNTDMVFYAVGRPRIKSREMEGQMPVEIWIYGTPPDPVTFVRINGNRVIRVEIAKVGEPMDVYTKDVVTPMLTASGSPELASESNTRTVKEGDAEIDPNKEAPAAPPTLRNPGEKLPTDNQSTGVMRPVQFPKDNPDNQPGANPDEQTGPPPASSQPSQPSGGQHSQEQQKTQSPQPAPADGSQPSQTPPANGGQPATGSSQLVSQNSLSPSN